ncbi:hypothetical protein PIROE2DRAFT_7336 [Piromyces sp. E2]|nr:hypothetical protein PIROE2DRAFT_7336 [Piromyces sp. E2]|eukprot:OUM65586.1 hypothetical protein PIROE2DRAFT_7336 [Piromyces sp. E2]
MDNDQTILICATETANCKIMEQIHSVKDSNGRRHININVSEKAVKKLEKKIINMKVDATLFPSFSPFSESTVLVNVWWI